MKLTKYRCHFLTIKDVLDDGICTLAYFHKDSVTSCGDSKKILMKKIVVKKIGIIEKDCNY